MYQITFQKPEQKSEAQQICRTPTLTRMTFFFNSSMSSSLGLLYYQTESNKLKMKTFLIADKRDVSILLLIHKCVLCLAYTT